MRAVVEIGIVGSSAVFDKGTEGELAVLHRILAGKTEAEVVAARLDIGAGLGAYVRAALHRPERVLVVFAFLGDAGSAGSFSGGAYTRMGQHIRAAIVEVMRSDPCFGQRLRPFVELRPGDPCNQFVRPPSFQEKFVRHGDALLAFKFILDIFVRRQRAVFRNFHEADGIVRRKHRRCAGEAHAHFQAADVLLPRVEPQKCRCGGTGGFGQVEVQIFYAAEIIRRCAGRKNLQRIAFTSSCAALDFARNLRACKPDGVSPCLLARAASSADDVAAYADSADLELVLVRLASGGMTADNAAFNIDLHIHRIIRGLACACGKTAINVPRHLALPERDLVVLDGAVIAGIADIATVEIPDAVFALAFKQQPVVQGAALCTLGLAAVSGKDAACLHALDHKVVFFRRLAEAGNAADNLIERLRAVIGDLTVLKAVHIKEQRARHIAVPLGVKRRLVFFGEVRPGMSGRAREMEILCRTLQKRQRVRALQRFELLIVNRGRGIIPLDAGVLPAGVHRNRIRDLAESSAFREFQQCLTVFNAVVETEIELVDIADFADFADFRIDIKRISRDLFIAAVINKAVVPCAALLRRHTVARSPNGQAFEIGVEIARLVAKVDDVVVRLARRAPGIAADKPVVRVHPAARHGDLVPRHIPRHGSVPAAAADNGSIRLEFSSFDKDLVPLRTAAGSHSKAAMNRADLAAPDGRRISLGRAVRDKGRAADDICDLIGDFLLHRHFVFFGILRRIIGGRSRRPCRLAAVDSTQPARRRAGHFQLIVRRRAPEIGYAAVYFAVRRRGGAVILLLGVAEAVVVQQHFLRRAGSRIGVQGKLIVVAIPRRCMIHRTGIAREIHHARALQERQLAFGLIRGKRRGVDLDLRPVHSASQTVIIRERQHGGAHADLVAQMEVERIEIAQRLDVNILRLDIQRVARDVACIAAAVERHAREIRACRQRRRHAVAKVHRVARRSACACRVAAVDVARDPAAEECHRVVRGIACIGGVLHIAAVDVLQCM